MKRLGLLSLLLLSITACTLSARQEEQLNRQLGRYLDATKKNLLLEIVGMTHPQVVRYYKSLGDSALVAHFDISKNLARGTLDEVYYSDMKSEGKEVQRKYSVRETTPSGSFKTEFYATSPDGGDNWFFLRKEEYDDNRISLKRLFKK